MTFALWDLEAGNLVGVYDSEAAALGVVREAIEAHGSRYVAALALVRETSCGRARVIAQSDALAERALQTWSSAALPASRRAPA